MTMPYVTKRVEVFYFCLFDGMHWKEQENTSWNEVLVVKPFIQMGVSIFLILLCIALSSILNGLALGLMTIDITGLKVIANAGSEKEKRYGKTILEVRSQGNFLLISLVIGSTLCNTLMTVLIDHYLNNWLTVFISTIIIVLCCEIIPCTIVPRYNLAIGANTIYITKAFMILTFPISYPLGKLLDKLLGEDFNNIYTRERIKELVKITSVYTNIKQLEANTITGALEMNAKKVEDVMTPIQDIYMLSIETYLDYSVISEIMRSGYSRIPIFEGQRNNIVKVLHVRDLALLDPDDKTPIRLFCQLAKTECIYVDEGSALDDVFNIFKEGVRGHMAFVCKPGDDPQVVHNVIGLLTLEDVIEELIQIEIVDEYDSIVDNRSKRKRDRMRMVADYLTAFAETFETKNVFISPHLRLATFQFLTCEIDAFRPDVISPKVLRRLLWLGVIVHMSGKKKTATIFSQEKASEGFVMIIEGRGIIILGPDKLKFECGPFSYFGLLSLDPNANLENKYDYTVETTGDVRFLKIPPDLYENAKRATQVEITGEEVDLTKEPYPGLFTEMEGESALQSPFQTNKK
ncbi:metal transporter CNNM2-like [Cimex lectularius]|uniref:CNNM transmembrane domain-containing protein n=1 Tax=Cimex lectularius TaxID=79782 RepID=A0A8I6S606_CIMLE|nr:metal transporter CNNM2-like [Cimex lectularius]XP_014256491.1 metal transporter CNNM2-like [Cimex lectularius]XP_014256492.1 metal transporter CNNM2-like [Cimex lectularius]XP_024084339.1 metal transporter CNNM2-like [Cimex lectularius]